MLLLSIPVSIFAEPQRHKKRIVLFTPTSENNTYWPQAYEILHAAAEDLNIVLQVHEFEVEDRFAKQIEGVKILKRKPKPDGALFSVAFGQAVPLLETAEQLGIPVFIQGPLFPSELHEIGKAPRRKYDNWIGYFYQDETEKGYKLAKTLISAAVEEGSFAEDEYIYVVGIGGDNTWFGSKLREDGLVRAVEDEPRAKLLQTVSTMWSQAEGKKKTALLLERYPRVSVVWAASDQLAIGACEALREAGRIVGKTVFTGGLDLSTRGLTYVKNGKMEATVAGTMFLYAEILILLHDYLHGIDFVDDVGTEISTQIYTATFKNIDLYLSMYQSYGDIDFKDLSKIYNTRLKKYDFSLESFHDARKE